MKIWLSDWSVRDDHDRIILLLRWTHHLYWLLVGFIIGVFMMALR
jgi:hypothetical protein